METTDNYVFLPGKEHEVKAPNFYTIVGHLVWKKGKNQQYVIDKERIAEPDWIVHMFGKMDYELFGEFVAAYLTVCHRNGLKKIKVNTSELVKKIAKVEFLK